MSFCLTEMKIQTQKKMETFQIMYKTLEIE